MAINPLKLMGMKDKLNACREAHPKFVQFLDVASKKIEKDSVVDVKITLPDGKTIETTIKLNDKDIELMKAVRELT